MAGFRYKKFSFTVGSEEFPAGTDASNIQIKERAIVKGFADALISMNIGWGCDTTRNATTSDFVDVPKYSRSEFAPGLFLKNATSGCKLFVTYLNGSATGGMCFYGTDGTTKILPDDQYVAGAFDSSYQSAKMSIGGLIISMIPEGSTNNFGGTFNESEFLPADATRLCGTNNFRVGSKSSVTYLSGNLYSSGDVITLRAFATPYCVAFANGNIIFNFVGRIIGDLAFPANDNTNQAKYGVIKVYDSGNSGTSYSEKNASPNITTSNGCSFFSNSSGAPSSTYSITTYGIGMSSYIPPTNARSGSTWSCNHVCSANGNWITSTQTRGVNVIAFYTLVYADAVFDSTSNNRPWVPFAVYVFSTNPQNDGVYNGSGFKGYLDTDLFRCMLNFSEGTVLDNGNFVCTNLSGLTLGWDPSNESW